MREREEEEEEEGKREEEDRRVSCTSSGFVGLSMGRGEEVGIPSKR